MSEAVDRGIVAHRVAYTMETLIRGYTDLGLSRNSAERLAAVGTLEMECRSWWERRGYTMPPIEHDATPRPGDGSPGT